jgi:phage replication-related protein YjqB (UPF0714/DUF867 family)
MYGGLNRQRTIVLILIITSGAFFIRLVPSGESEKGGKQKNNVNHQNSNGLFSGMSTRLLVEKMKKKQAVKKRSKQKYGLLAAVP